jgi:hypothetical protein
MRRLLLIPLGIAFAAALSLTDALAEKRVKAPVMEEAEGIRRLLLPDDVTSFIAQEFPGSRVPDETQFNPEMLQYFFSRLIGVHPAVAFGDFNGDKKRDYMMLLITSETKWGPLCELVVLNGRKKGFESFRLGEVYNFKDDYVSFNEGKLYKGRYKKGGWYITVDKKKGSYIVTKA